ncbi:hypothetical protein AB0F92_21510, partial [Kitasatospora aureofaciens]
LATRQYAVTVGGALLVVLLAVGAQLFFALLAADRVRSAATARSAGADQVPASGREAATT